MKILFSIFNLQVELHHNDRLVFGSTQLWVFQNPKEKGIGKFNNLSSFLFLSWSVLDKKKYPPITFEYAQEEIAAKAGIKVDTAAGGDMALLQEDLIDVMPAVEEANSISEELDKRVKFEIILISPHMLGKMQGTKAEVGTIFRGSNKQVNLSGFYWYEINSAWGISFAVFSL